MHWNLGTAATLLGIAFGGAVLEERFDRGDELAKELIMSAGSDDWHRFCAAWDDIRAKNKFYVDSIRDDYWWAAKKASAELQAAKDGRPWDKKYVQRFRALCRSLPSF